MYWELKKIVMQKKFLILFGIILIYIGYWCSFEIGGINDRAVNYEGKFIRGKKAIEYNQYIANLYKGKITSEKLILLNREYNKGKIAYSELGEEVRNTTYDYFQRAFDIKDNIYSVEEVYPNFSGDLYYGYSDSWQSLIMDIDSMMTLMPLFIIVVFAGIFSCDRECGVWQLIITSKYGRKGIVNAKLKAAFLSLNIVTTIIIGFLCVFFFIRYGFIGYDTSIQCGEWYYFFSSDYKFDFVTMLLHGIILDYLVINTIMLIVLIISLKTKNVFRSMVISLIVIYLFQIDSIHNIIQNEWLDRVISIVPINALSMHTVADISSLHVEGVTLYWIWVLEMLFVLGLIGALGLLKKESNLAVYRQG